MVKDRNTAIFYTTAVCNLKCKYCVIDKNPVLKKIDETLDESFKGDYYFNFVKELFPDKNQLTRVELWGGEPYLAMHRVYYTLEKLIDYFPNLSEVYGSTNLVSPQFISELAGLLKILGTKQGKIKFRLQLSLDGTKEITDLNRGEGVTERISKRLLELADILPTIVPNNVELEAFFKPTLDKYSLHLLDSKDKIISYINFFERFYDLFEKKIQQLNIHLLPSLPNFAMPSDFTQEDGFFFRDFCKMTRELEKEHHFKYFRTITLFDSAQGSQAEYKALNPCMDYNVGLCGTGRQTVGFLPNRMVSMCHMAFVDLIADYKKAVTVNKNRITSVDEGMFTNYYANNFCFPVEKLGEYEAIIDKFYQFNSKAKTATLTNEIMMLAYAGQVQPKYKDQKEAIKGANFLCSHMSYCVKDNMGATGSYYCIPTGTIKVFLNGAEDYIMNNVKEETK